MTVRPIVHPRLLLKAIAGITSSETTFDKFQLETGITSKTVAKDILEFLKSNQIGSITSGRALFTASDKLKTAIISIKMGCDTEEISKYLCWKDFELLASEMLVSAGYKTQSNLRFTKPRMEIDVVGINASLAVVVDCKHWEKSNLSSILLCARKQIKRTESLLWRLQENYDYRNVTRAIPAILTLHAEKVKFLEGIPIIPISHFRSFIENIQGYLRTIQTVARVN